MAWRNTRQAWGRIAIGLHWLTALAVIGLFALGYWMVDLDYYHPWYRQAPALHKSIGMLLAIGVLGRLGWRYWNPSPQALGRTAGERWLASVVHGLLYLLLAGCLLSGYLISTADGSAIAVFEWFRVPALVSGIDRQEDIAGNIHRWLTWALVVLAGLHALAAIKHHALDRDETLRRMLGLNARRP